MTEGARTSLCCSRTHEVVPLVRSLVTGGTSYTGRVDDFTAALINIAHTISLTIGIGRGGSRLIQLIPIAIGVIGIHKVLTSLEGTLPTLLFEITMPDDTVTLGIRRAVIVRLISIIKWRGIEEQDLCL